MSDEQNSVPEPMSSWPPGGIDADLERLQSKYLPSRKENDFAGLLQDPALKQAAIVSSFGAESAVLLHWVLSNRPEIPVIFIDTGKHFDETLQYRDRLHTRLGFQLINAVPDPATLLEEDPRGTLNQIDPNSCCTIRKTFPLQDALNSFSSWISGRKRFQGASRAALPIVERDGARIKVNPLALWSRDEIERYFRDHDLPRHPLETARYASIGCAPCTRPTNEGEDPRAGRWPQMPDKSECGIHLGPDGHFVRVSAARKEKDRP